MKPTNDEATLPTSALLAALWQLRRFIGPHRRGLYIGIAAFGVARLFEAMVPVLTAVSINRMADGNFDLLYPVLGIVGAVVIGLWLLVTSLGTIRRLQLLLLPSITDSTRANRARALTRHQPVSIVQDSHIAFRRRSAQEPAVRP